MIWTKKKALAESFLADSLAKRIQYYRTRYGSGYSTTMNRGWITFDQKEIFSCSTIKSAVELHQSTGVWYSHDVQVINSLHRQGVFTLNDFDEALDAVVLLKIEDVLASGNPLSRALAMFDRRLGKRKLEAITVSDEECSVVKDFYLIRCGTEGLLGD